MTSHVGKDYASLKQLVWNTLAKLRLGGEHARVSLVYFGKLAFTELSLDEGDDALEVQRTIMDASPLDDEAANYYGALWVTKNSVFLSSNGDRSTAPNVAVLVSDSYHSRAISSQAVARSAGEARDSGIPLCVVGVDHMVDHDLLEDMTNSNDDILYVADYEAMSDDTTAGWLVNKIRQLGAYINIIMFEYA